MNFANRLHTALFDNVLVEFASFSLPESIPMPDRQGNIVYIKYLDMRWEDYKNSYVSKWGQWTPFVADLPVRDGYVQQYLIWDGAKAEIASSREINAELLQTYYSAPKKWWEMAQGMDADGKEIIQPKLRREVEI